MSTAIKIGPGLRGIKFENVGICGFDTGIEAAGAEFSANGVTFENVRQPFDVTESRAAIKGTRISPGPSGGFQSKGSSMGWRRSNGPPLPVFCGNCKNLFPSTDYNFGGAYFNLWDNEEPCPKCGFEHAKLSEGVFDLARETIHVLSAPDVTYVMLQALVGIASQVQAGQLPIATAVQQVEAIAPALGAIVKQAFVVGPKVAAWIIATVISLGALHYGIRAVELGKAQLEIAEEQLRLQKESESSPDAILEEALKCLPGQPPQAQAKPNNEHDSGKRAAEQSPEDKVTARGKGYRLKSRDLRRIAERKRRQEFGRSRHG